MPIKVKTLSLIFGILVVVVLSLSMGSYKVSMKDIYFLLLGKLDDPYVKKVLLDMRFKKVLTALVVGGVLGVSGAAMQSVLRNPLASPFTLGIQHAAALGAALALMALYGGTIERFSIKLHNPFLVAGMAFLAAFLQTVFILGLSRMVGLSVYAIVLVSIGLAFLTQALLSLLQYIFLNEIVVAAILFWTFGDTGRVGWAEVGIIGLVALVLLGFLLCFAVDLDLISVSDEVAHSSGVKVERCRFLVLLFCALGTAIVVCFVGIIGFVGVVAGQMARLMFGWTNRRIIPFSALIGGLLLAFSDLLGRTILSPTVIPVGIMTSIIGAPFLIYLLLGVRHAQGARS